jgi:ribose/xylose/arabinose/galactoside ABC-type transport system permease subunit
MYFWKVDNLVEDFKSGKMNQKEEFKYMLLSTVLMIFASDPLLYIGNSYNIYDSVSTILMLAVSVWGVYYCYNINSSGDNKDFIVRVICIGLPVGIRLLVIFIPIFILVGTLGGFLNEELMVDESNPEVYKTMRKKRSSRSTDAVG